MSWNDRYAARLRIGDNDSGRNSRRSVFSGATADDVRAIAAAAGEPAWLATWRHDAWDVWEQTPLPDRVKHLWRYTDPEKFLIDKVTPVLPAAAGQAEDELPAGMQESPAGVGIVDDASLQTAWLAPEWREAGVIITDLATAASTHEELVREHLGRAVGADAGKFEALNAALFPGGVLVYVPRGVAVAGPIHLFRRHGIDLSAAFPRLLIVIDEGAEATIIDEYSNPGDPRVVANAVVEGTVMPNAPSELLQHPALGFTHTQPCTSAFPPAA